MRMFNITAPTTLTLLIVLLHGCGTNGKIDIPNTEQPPAVRSLLSGLRVDQPVQNDPIDIRGILNEATARIGEPFRIYPCTMDITASATISTEIKADDYTLLYYPIARNDSTICAILVEKNSGQSTPAGYGFTDFIRRIERTYANIPDTSAAGKEHVIFHMPELGLYFFRDREHIISPFDNSILGIRAGKAYDARKTMNNILACMKKRIKEQQKNSIVGIDGFVERPSN